MAWPAYQSLIQQDRRVRLARAYRFENAIASPASVVSTASKRYVVTTAADTLLTGAPSEADRLTSIVNAYVVYRAVWHRSRSPQLAAYLTNGTTQVEVETGVASIKKISKHLLKHGQRAEDRTVETLITEWLLRNEEPESERYAQCPLPSPPIPKSDF